jgi:hypothetical protein
MVLNVLSDGLDTGTASAGRDDLQANKLNSYGYGLTLVFIICMLYIIGAGP